MHQDHHVGSLPEEATTFLQLCPIASGRGPLLPVAGLGPRLVRAAKLGARVGQGGGAGEAVPGLGRGGPEEVKGYRTHLLSTAPATPRGVASFLRPG